MYFKSLQSGDVVHTNILTFIAFGHERNDCVTNNLKAVLKRSGVDVNHSVKRVKLKTSDYPPVLRSTCLHTLFTIGSFISTGSHRAKMSTAGSDSVILKNGLTHFLLLKTTPKSRVARSDFR